jgi:transposase
MRRNIGSRSWPFASSENVSSARTRGSSHPLADRTEGGELIEQRIRTEPERFAAVFGPRPRARILLEASTDSEWVARCLEGLGHEVIVADPNFAPMDATRTRKVKTDRRDARALRDACLLGAYRRPIGCPIPSATCAAA